MEGEHGHSLPSIADEIDFAHSCAVQILDCCKMHPTSLRDWLMQGLLCKLAAI